MEIVEAVKKKTKPGQLWNDGNGHLYLILEDEDHVHYAGDQVVKVLTKWGKVHTKFVDNLFFRVA